MAAFFCPGGCLGVRLQMLILIDMVILDVAKLLLPMDLLRLICFFVIITIFLDFFLYLLVFKCRIFWAALTSGYLSIIWVLGHRVY